MMRGLRALAALLAGLILAAAAASAATPDPAPGAARAGDPSEAPARLRVLTVERPPFAMRDGDRMRGFSIELWDRIAQRIGAAYVVDVAPDFASMLDAVARADADLAVANISITAEREERLDFSQPIFDAGLQIMIREDSSGGSLLASILSPQLLGLASAALALIFAIGMLMWLAERRHNRFFRRPLRDAVWLSFWWAMQRIFSGGFEQPIPRTAAGRLIGVLTTVLAIFVVSAFVATITSTITVRELRSDIRQLADLRGKRVGTTRGSTAAATLRAEGIAAREFADVAGLIAALESKSLDAVVHDAPVLAYHAAGAGSGKVRMAGAVFRPEKYGIALPDRSRLREPIDRALLRLREDGTYDALYARYFGRSER